MLESLVGLSILMLHIFVRHRVMSGDMRVRVVSTRDYAHCFMTRALAGPAHVEAVKELGMSKTPANEY
jgi:hypothetical protein